MTILSGRGRARVHVNEKGVGTVLPGQSRRRFAPHPNRRTGEYVSQTEGEALMSKVASYVSPPPCLKAAEPVEMVSSYGLYHAGRHFSQRPLLTEPVMPW